MKKRNFMKILLCILFGAILSSFLYKNYIVTKKEYNTSSPSKVYFIQVGAYTTSTNVSKVTKTLSNYLVIKEKGMYKIVTAVTTDKNLVDKLVKIYNDKGFNVYVKYKNVKDKTFLRLINKYDEVLKETNDIETILNVNKEGLKLYEKRCLNVN